MVEGLLVLEEPGSAHVEVRFGVVEKLEMSRQWESCVAMISLDCRCRAVIRGLSRILVSIDPACFTVM